MKDELAKKSIRMVGQSPILTERWDDKAETNFWLAKQQGLEGAFPKSRIINKGEESNLDLEGDGIGWPRILKPIRGRGSHGVAVIKDEEGFRQHLETLFAESSSVLVEVGQRCMIRDEVHGADWLRNTAGVRRSRSLSSHLENIQASVRRTSTGRCQ
jgi:carbamoylphosphate synthase large subunit